MKQPVLCYCEILGIGFCAHLVFAPAQIILSLLTPGAACHVCMSRSCTSQSQMTKRKTERKGCVIDSSLFENKKRQAPSLPFIKPESFKSGMRDLFPRVWKINCGKWRNETSQLITSQNLCFACFKVRNGSGISSFGERAFVCK